MPFQVIDVNGRIKQSLIVSGPTGPAGPTGATGPMGAIIPPNDGIDGEPSFILLPNSGGSSRIVQVVNTQTGAVATGTTVIPLDDTIPQNTEGDQYMTLAITPTNVNNILKIDVVAFLTSSAANWITAALFQDTTANALAAFNNYQNIASGANHVHFTHWMIAGTISSTTFKVRAGRDASAAGTVTFNGILSNRFFGGVIASSITITEILV